ncbi:MAG: prolyl oligopeptidase family serine peptidase [Acidobacteria bacterium]|nr:prolyl oligopeptidase family serine peptidase [Acidobacteriota bacterium]
MLAQNPAIAYPETRRSDHTDVYHGMTVADPYRWLEDDVRESAEVRAWVEAENEVTFSYLESLPQREPIRKRLEKLWDYEKVGDYFKEGGKYYFFKNDGLQNQAVLYEIDELGAQPQVVVDPNGWSADGTVALGALAFSEDGRYMAYGVNKAGSDWQTWKVLDVAARKELADQLDWVKFSGAEWTKDGRGFFYGRYAEPESGAAFQSTNLNQKLYYHRIGTPQADDVLVYERPDHPDWGFSPSVSSDGRWLVITTWKGTDDKYRVAYKDLTEPYGFPVELVANFDQEYSFLDADGPVFYFQTDLDAPTRRIIAIDTRRPARENWREVVPAAEETLIGSGLIGNVFVCSYLKDARSQVKIFDLQGKLVREVEFPGIGTASGFMGSRGDTETFYSFSSYAKPPTIYRYDLLTGKSTEVLTTRVPVDFSEYTTEQVFYPSKDGTKIPMFLTYRKGMQRSGQNPTMLYGYGGFNISITPSFSTTWMSWLDLGGVLAVANLRGGGEYGEEWHQAGTKTHKQNVFDDFIAAAEWLISSKITSTPKLAIHGRSNGGLLVGAALTQRPDLFGAALPAVGVMDMLRFHQFTAGRFWVDDYGSADDPSQFESLYAYSPYHSLKKHSVYPPTLVTTADTDDRVVPGHSFKFAAELQHQQKGPAPVLIRIETSAGHGAGKPTSKQIEELADEWTFVSEALKMDLHLAQ